MTVFDTEKTVESYETPQLFLGDEMGLLDTINHHYPDLFKWYKEMKSRDWDEQEFDFHNCLNDFENGDPTVVDFMVKTLLWQWEADSVAAKAPAPLIAPFCSSSDLWCAEMRITDNELVHGFTYSEIVRLGYGKPKQVLRDLLQVRDTLQRLDKVASTLNNFQKLSHEYALGITKLTREEILEEIIKFYFILLILERVQFMASFAVTFSICETGMFQPIGMAVRKIAQDELEVHVEFRKAVLQYIRQTEEGEAAFQRVKPQLKEFLLEVIQSEMNWCDYLFTDPQTGKKEGRELTGLKSYKLKSWVLYNAKFVDRFAELNLDNELEEGYPEKNPLPFLEDWFDLSAFQVAPQEQINNQYKIVNVVSDVDDEEDLNIL